MEKNKIEEAALLAQEGMLLNKIDIQVLFHLLIEHGLLKAEDIKAKRDYISQQRIYSHPLDAIHRLQNDNKEAQKFENEFTKYLKSDRKEGDIDYINKHLGI